MQISAICCAFIKTTDETRAGKLGEDDELLPDLDLKYFDILLVILLNIDKRVAGQNKTLANVA